MKRVKRILCTLLIIFSICLITACSKNYGSITYKRFNEKLGSDFNYSITDNTLAYQDVYVREIEALTDDVMFMYFEFNSTDDAKNFMQNRYANSKGISYNQTDDYTIAKSGKNGYLKIIQVDNIVITGTTQNKAKSREIKKVFKALGY